MVPMRLHHTKCDDEASMWALASQPVQDADYGIYHRNASIQDAYEAAKASDNWRATS